MRAPAGPLPVILDAAGQRADIPRIPVIIVDEAGLGKPAPALQNLGGLIESRTRRRGAVLRIQRQYQELLRVLLRKCGDGAGNARIAVRHAELDPYTVAKPGLEHPADLGGETPGVHRQRRTLAHPDLAVIS